MAGSLTNPVVGRTRWRPFLGVLAPAFAAVALLIYAIASGAVAVSFALSGNVATVTASSLTTTGPDGNGRGFYLYPVLDFNGNGTTTAAFSNVVPHADLASLCQSVTIPGLPTGVFLRITAGDAGTPAHADNLVTDVEGTTTATTATFTNINIGQDMGFFSNPALTNPTARGTGPNVTVGNVGPGTFGQVADSATLGGLKQTLVIGTSAGSFTLPHLSLGLGGTC